MATFYGVRKMQRFHKNPESVEELVNTVFRISYRLQRKRKKFKRYPHAKW